MIFNRPSFYIIWRQDQQKDSFLELILLALKFWTYKEKVAYVARTVKVFDGKFLSTEENQIHGLCWEEEPTYWILRQQDLRILATHHKGPEREDLLQTSLMQECFNFKS